jgi:hypothetical protein
MLVAKSASFHVRVSVNKGFCPEQELICTEVFQERLDTEALVRVVAPGLNVGHQDSMSE